MRKSQALCKPRRLVLLFCILCCFPSRFRAQTVEDIVVTYALAAPQVGLHEPIVLEFSARNNSPVTLSLSLGKDDKEHFLITITRPDGARLPLPPLLREGIGTTGRHSVSPGEAYTKRLVLNEWSDFRDLGKYDVEVRLTEPVKSADGRVVAEVPPFNTSLEILPREPVRLQETCELLVRRTHAAPSYEEAAEAAHELSYVRDPIAVPYLATVLDMGRLLVERQAVDGLRRIANRDAVDVLIRALGRGPREMWSSKESMAAGALGMIWLETPDPKLRATIEQAFSRSGLKLPEIQR